MCGKPTYMIGYIVTVCWCMDWSVWETYLHDRIHSFIIKTSLPVSMAGTPIFVYYLHDVPFHVL